MRGSPGENSSSTRSISFAASLHLPCLTADSTCRQSLSMVADEAETGVGDTAGALSERPPPHAASITSPNTTRRVIERLSEACHGERGKLEVRRDGLRPSG